MNDDQLRAEAKLKAEETVAAQKVTANWHATAATDISVKLNPPATNAAEWSAEMQRVGIHQDCLGIITVAPGAVDAAARKDEQNMRMVFKATIEKTL